MIFLNIPAGIIVTLNLATVKTPNSGKKHGFNLKSSSPTGGDTANAALTGPFRLTPELDRLQFLGKRKKDSTLFLKVRQREY